MCQTNSNESKFKYGTFWNNNPHLDKWFRNRTHLQLMSDRVTVSIEEEDQGGHLTHGARLSGGAAHAQSILNLNQPTEKHIHFRHVHGDTHAETQCSVCLTGKALWQEATPGPTAAYLAGEHGFDHLCVLTGEHGAGQTEDHTHGRQQHEE